MTYSQEFTSYFENARNILISEIESGTKNNLFKITSYLECSSTIVNHLRKLEFVHLRKIDETNTFVSFICFAEYVINYSSIL